MTNQWGRDSQVSTRAKEKSIFLPVIFSLVFGAALSYGVTDYLSSGKVPQSELTDANKQISDLEQKIFTLQGKLDDASKTAGSDMDAAGQMDALKAENQQLTDLLSKGQSDNTQFRKTIDELRGQISTLKAQVSNGEDNADLAKKLSETEGLLDAARRKLQTLDSAVSALADANSKNTELSKTIVQLQANIAALTADASKGKDVLASRANQLEKANQQLGADLLALQEASTKQLKSANDRLAVAKAELQASQKTSKTLADQIASLQADAAKIQSSYQAQIADLGKTLEAERANASALQAKLDDATRQAASQMSAVDKSKTDELQSLRTELVDATQKTAASAARIDELQGLLSESNSKLADAQAQLAAMEKPAVKQVDQTTKASPKPARDENLVARSLETATGVAALPQTRKSDLKNRLVSGECVADAIKTVLGNVPRLMLRDLIRDLKSDC